MSLVLLSLYVFVSSQPSALKMKGPKRKGDGVKIYFVESLVGIVGVLFPSQLTEYG